MPQLKQVNISISISKHERPKDRTGRETDLPQGNQLQKVSIRDIIIGQAHLIISRIHLEEEPEAMQVDMLLSAFQTWGCGDFWKKPEKELLDNIIP